MQQRLRNTIDKISNKYKELRKCEFPIVQKMIIAELRKLSRDAMSDMEQEEQPQHLRMRKQIEDILNKCVQVQKIADEKLAKENKQMQRESVHNEDKWKQQSRSVVLSMVMYEVHESQLKISPDEIKEITHKIQQNLEVMKEIEQLVREQGENLDKIGENVDETEVNVKVANQLLQQAKEQQHIGRLLKISMGISGFFGIVGLKLFGLPGLVAGLFGGFRAGKAGK